MRVLRLAVLGLVSLAVQVGPASAQQPGERIEVRAADMPPPAPEDSASNPPRIIARSRGAAPTVPPGFTVTLFAEGFEHARWLAVSDNGDVFLAEPRAGRITLLRDEDGDGRAEHRQTFADGFERPHGMAFHGDFLYVAALDHVWRLPYRPGQVEAESRQPVTPQGALGDPGGHWTRNIAIHPDGQRFYVAVGSRGNLAEEPPPRATIQEFRIDGSGQRTFASGLRNPVGIAFRPGGVELWAVVNERDRMGDGLVPDYLTRVQEGAFYGWPYSYIGGHPQPGFAEKRPDLVAAAVEPDLLFQAHSAPLGLVFYEGAAFPEGYRGDAFVALHGSWNASEPRGYTVVRVPFEGGRPLGHYEVFASGFRAEGTDRARVWGRPVGLAVAADGSLLVADDTGQTVWRIAAER